jgi:hypothetical protein
LSGRQLLLQLRASPVLTLLTAAVHVAAAVILVAMLPSPAGGCAAVLVCVLGFIGMRQKTLLIGRLAPAALELKSNGRLCLRLKGGGEIDAEPAERRFVNRWLVVLQLASRSRENRSLLVARDMLPAADFRLLRLWALWKALPRAAGSAAGVR